MKHASPNEIKTILDEVTLKRVIFRRSKVPSSVIIEMLANDSEEITISEQGTPDPILFPQSEVVQFFQFLDLFSEKYNQTIIDARTYCPAQFDFLRKKPEMTIQEFYAYYESKSHDIVNDEPHDFQEEIIREVEEEKSSESEVSPVDEMLKESFSELEKADQEIYQKHQVFVEKYLTTRNLMRVTGVLIIAELLLTMFFPPLAPVMKHVIYICAALNMVVAVWVCVYEHSQPDDTKLSMRRMIWLCLIVFNLAMVITYVLSKTIIYYGSLATFGVGHLR